jgi:hypothetical protein
VNSTLGALMGVQHLDSGLGLWSFGMILAFDPFDPFSITPVEEAADPVMGSSRELVDMLIWHLCRAPMLLSSWKFSWLLGANITLLSILVSGCLDW